MKDEMDSRLGLKLTDKEFKLINDVYMYYPPFDDDISKDFIAVLFKQGGIAIFQDLYDASAKEMKKLFNERAQIDRQINDRKSYYLKTQGGI